MPSVSIKTTVEVELDLDTAAKWFAELDDDTQAQFFCKVAAQTSTWINGNGNTQWWFVGRHLATCECSTEEGRDMIRNIHDAMQHALTEKAAA